MTRLDGLVVLIYLPMDSAQLHTELQKSGERLLHALSLEREAKRSELDHLTCSRWHLRLELARCNVERAAEYYARALTAYRSAVIKDFPPSSCSTLLQTARPAQPCSEPAALRSPFRASHSHPRGHSKRELSGSRRSRPAGFSKTK